jgi:predicted transcriptional regulator
MTNDAPSATLYKCDSCGNLGIGQDGMICCDNAMERVSDENVGVSEPSIDQLLRIVFDMSETELDICLCVMEGGEQTVAELAEQVDYDRSVVSRHLNHLADLGVVDKRRRILKEGGQVYVYTPNDPAAVRRNLVGAFTIWAQKATSLIDSLSRQKVEAIVKTNTQDPQSKIYQE